MSRPATYEDLPAYARKGSTVISVELSALPPEGPVLRALGALLDTLKSEEFVTGSEYNTITVSRIRTTEELDSALNAAQSEWDATQQKYLRWAETYSVPEETSAWVAGNVLSWARKELPDADLDWLIQAHKDAKVRDAQKS